MKLLPQVAQIPTGCSAEVAKFRGKDDWLVEAAGSKGGSVAEIWFGPDPPNRYMFDGLIRIGQGTRKATQSPSSGRPFRGTLTARMSDKNSEEQREEQRLPYSGHRHCRYTGCSKTVVVPCSKHVRTDQNGGNRGSCKWLRNQIK